MKQGRELNENFHFINVDYLNHPGKPAIYFYIIFCNNKSLCIFFKCIQIQLYIFVSHGINKRPLITSLVVKNFRKKNNLLYLIHGQFQ